MNLRSFCRNSYLSLLGAFKKPQNGIHILHGHYVTPKNSIFKKDFELYSNFLEYIQSLGCVFMPIQEATMRIASDNVFLDKPYVAFSFDDGFKECYEIIAPLLESFGVNAAFFINANYVGSSFEYQKKFNKIVGVDTKNPMNWAEIKDLHRRGHVIGSHTLDHVNLGSFCDNHLQFQIERNKEVLETKLDYICDYFAWPFGQKKFFSEESLSLLLKNHKYIFSGTDYKFYKSYNGKVINRRHLESFWPESHIKYFLSTDKK